MLILSAMKIGGHYHLQFSWHPDLYLDEPEKDILDDLPKLAITPFALSRGRQYLTASANIPLFITTTD